ncbi:hypothetical protein [Noviherbaspirillum denitrificans]|uniref:Uncharacterized protein n=1 Tax=Noviherbaspirillum denitrificans TaxID=1968433 RepID=A0A254TFQ4_9BURK|nr:hypothetical protein [Noviherbaspirillum denitrificans]OWW21355.1 hypothetical protein AYR66_19590 [Noviherbaspirillum denitrificans]
MQCEECISIPSFNYEECGQCPEFLNLLARDGNPDANRKAEATGRHPLAQLVGMAIVSAGALSAIAGLPEVALGTIIFGAGVLLAELVNRDWPV